VKTTLLLALGLAAAGGWLAASRPHANKSAPTAATNVAATGWQCPMHPWFKAAATDRCTVCGMALVAPGTRGPVHTRSTDWAVMLPPGSASIIGLRTAVVRPQVIARTLRVAGVLEEDESRRKVFSAPVEGRIEGLAMVGEGEKITLRQPVIRLMSRTLLALTETYRQALPRGGAELEAAKQQLLRHGLVWEQVASIATRQPDDLHYGLLSPASGVVVKSYVTDGQYVKEGERLMEIADFSRLWFQFEAYEQDLAFLRTGLLVDLTSPALPGQTLTARVAFISPELDAGTRTARVRVVVENPDRRIRANISAQGVVHADAPEVMAIPRSAVIWPGSAPRVFVQTGNDTYVQRRVKLGRAGDTLWEVLDGLQAGELIVAQAAMLLDGQAQLEGAAEAPRAPEMCVAAVAP